MYWYHCSLLMSVWFQYSGAHPVRPSSFFVHVSSVIVYCWFQDITGYRSDGLKTFLFYVLVVFTLGILLLVLYWKPELDCYMKRKECPLYSADVILVRVSILNSSRHTAECLPKMLTWCSQMEVLWLLARSILSLSGFDSFTYSFLYAASVSHVFLLLFLFFSFFFSSFFFLFFFTKI